MNKILAMPQSSALEKLRVAIQAEQSAVQDQLNRYLVLNEKMAASQRSGQTLSAADHEEWESAVKAIEKMRDLQGALPNPGATLRHFIKWFALRVQV